jgi:hypothetical protein
LKIYEQSAEIELGNCTILTEPTTENGKKAMNGIAMNGTP